MTERLHTIGRSLRTTPEEEIACRVRSAIADLDAVVTQIRETALLLDDMVPRPMSAVHDRLRDVLFEACAEQGLIGSIEFAGRTDVVVSDERADELAGVLREGLRLIARHTGAAAVQLTVWSDEVRLSAFLGHDGNAQLTMLSDADLAEFAEPTLRRGGIAEIDESALTWWVPLDRQQGW
ncbi:hypothetical protein ACIOD2_47075 [Amycolatopsis sp. NPDC088138]|uniref:hypothetical protein n=1 Tax=Amycolatopsis sp. NPDC088138 TaxID=3363938 RepID=UPI00382692A7